MSLTLENNNNNQLILQNKLDFLIRDSVFSTLATWVLAVLYTSVLIDQIDNEFLFNWFKLTTLAVVIRIAINTAYLKISPQGRHILKWKYPYFISIIFSTSCWGIGSLYFLPLLSVEYQLVTYFYIVALTSAILAIYSSFWYFVLITAFSTIIPTTIWFINFGDTLHFNVASCALVLIVMGTIAAKRLSCSLHNQTVLAVELKQANLKAEEYAKNDFLTDINNRFAFTEFSELQLDYCKRHQHPVALIIMDVDFFKQINDKHGHSAGDRALINLANVLQKSIRASDICARIGGEEFAVFLPNTNKNSALNVAEKIRLLIQNEKMGSAIGNVNLTVSMGVCTQIDTLDNMLSRADNAMYQAKNNGRNNVVHFDDNPNQANLF